MTTATIIKTYEARSAVLLFREDGYFNMTKAAKVFNRRLSNFKALPSTAEYLYELSSSLKISQEKLMTATVGSHDGTWAHPKLAVFFARWLDTKFALWCDATIEDILKGHQKLEMVTPEASAVVALPEEFKAQAAQWGATLKDLQQQMENQAAALLATQDLLQGFVLKSQGESKQKEYVTLKGYLEAVGVYEKNTELLKRMAHEATRYCEYNGLSTGFQRYKFRDEEATRKTYPKRALSHAFEVVYRFKDDELQSF